MKKLLLFSFTLLALSFVISDNPLSKKERDSAVKLLKDTEKRVLSEVKGLSEAQLTFKPADDRWSVEECVKHIAISEQNIWQMIDSALKQPATPDKRGEVKVTDEKLVQMIEDRSKKVKTTEKFEPQNTPFKSANEALESFKNDRAKLVDYVKTTNEDLRNRMVTLPFGQVDCYQMVLFIAAHSNRHTQQIQEVKADPNFPKN